MNKKTNLGKMEIEMYVIDREDELRKKYGNNYIAVTGEGVIGSDENISRLLGRLDSRKYADKRFIIGTIDEILNGESAE